MNMLKNNDLKRILSNESVRKELIDQTFRDDRITNQILQDLSNEILNFLKDDLSFKQKLLSVAIEKPECRRKIITEVVKEFRD